MHTVIIFAVFYSSTLTIFHTEINICSPLKKRNLRIFGFVVNSPHDWIVHTTQARQTNSVDCDMNITKVLRRLGTDLHYGKNIVRTKVILKIYTHTTYVTYSIANLRKRLSRTFSSSIKASLFWFKRAIRVQRQYFQSSHHKNTQTRRRSYHALYNSCDFKGSECYSPNHSSVFAHTLRLIPWNGN